MKLNCNFLKSKVFVYILLQNNKSLLGYFDRDWNSYDSKNIFVLSTIYTCLVQDFFVNFIILLILKSWGHAYNF
jgi:hypothetical protein